jgi:hypothetical protein
MAPPFLLPLPSLWAQDVACLGVERYEQLDRVRNADDILRATDRLEALGFDVFSCANPRIAAADRLGVSSWLMLIVWLIALSGHFVTDGFCGMA